jgi:hypothetical protein
MIMISGSYHTINLLNKNKFDQNCNFYPDNQYLHQYTVGDDYFITIQTESVERMFKTM